MNDKYFKLLNEQQDAIVNAKEKKIVVSAGPGSGKTFTLVKRIKQELSENNYSVIVTSFTKEAAGQLKNKLSQVNDLHDSYIGTLDSFIFNEIINKFKNRYLNIMRYDNKILRLKTTMPERNSLVEELTKEGIKDSNIHLIKYSMNRWLKDLSKGKYEISSISYLISCDLLSKCTTAKKFIESKYKTIYIDEAQDLNEYQHHFIEFLMNKCNMSVVFIGDKNQSIYQFRGSRPELFYQLKDTDGFKEYKITVSVRCDASILSYSNLIIDESYEIPEIYENKVKLYISPTKDVLNSIKGNFLILFENNKDAIECFKYCRQNNINAIYTKKLELSNKGFSDEYLEILEEIITFRLNVCHSNSKLVYSVLDFEDFLSNHYIIDYKLKNAINRIELELLPYLFNLMNVLKIRIDNDTINEINYQLHEELYYKHYVRRDGENRIMTIHSSKGLEADNVFVRLSFNPRKIDDEYRRKLFVAFSRAKNNLYVSYKKDSNIMGSCLDSLLKNNLLKLENKI